MSSALQNPLATTPDAPSKDQVSVVLENFAHWLERYGETSRDHQSFFAGPIGGPAKALYYRHRLLGTAAVAPMIFCEAFLPWARHLFHRPERFPIADAHYAMGFCFLHQATGETNYLERAVHFLRELQNSRSPGFSEYCWGYPSDWVTRNGVIKAQTPLITSTPYAYEAFLQGYEILQAEDAGRRAEWSEWGERHRRCSREGSGERAGCERIKSEVRGQTTGDGGQRTEDERRRVELGDEFAQILASIARHAANDIKDFPTSAAASSCSYSPYGGGGVINAAAYRAFLLTSASFVFSREDYRSIGQRNANFVLENQNADGSWFYAVDGVRDFVDHFHTCFIMKALAKIHRLTGEQAILDALRKGVSYYLENLFAEDGLPKPFSRAPRLTVYKRELYDCAECINLCLLLRNRFSELDATLQTVVTGVLTDWIKPDGSFRSRQLHLGWDNVPMHRWAQSQMFRSLACYLREMSKPGRSGSRNAGDGNLQRQSALVLRS